MDGNGILEIEPTATADTGRCACCGRVSRAAWGWVLRDGDAEACYFVHWTVGHVFDNGANIDLILGPWGDETQSSDRYAVSLECRILESGPSLRVIDAQNRPTAKSDLADRWLKRTDVIGGPIAAVTFAFCDAILTQDRRLDALWDAPEGN
jgi:hypothetical protein